MFLLLSTYVTNAPKHFCPSAINLYLYTLTSNLILKMNNISSFALTITTYTRPLLRLSSNARNLHLLFTISIHYMLSRIANFAWIIPIVNNVIPRILYLLFVFLTHLFHRSAVWLMKFFCICIQNIRLLTAIRIRIFGRIFFFLTV